MSKFIINAFIWIFKVDFKEAQKEVSEYPNLREFFIRKLKPGLRPLASSEAVHPSDSRLQEKGEILPSKYDDPKLIQAKGSYYSLKDFTQDPQSAQKWSGGFFATYYLHPRDYHWVHSPMSGTIKAIRKIEGQLWPVNAPSVRLISSLYVKNARVFIELDTSYGPVGVCLVGAFNVGRISIEAQEGQKIQKGDALGYFNFGSTVVVLYPKSFYEKYKDQFQFIEPIRMGASLVLK